MQEVRDALPAAAGADDDGMIRKGRLANRLHQQAGPLKRDKIVLQWTMPAVERHGQAVALDLIGIAESTEIVALDDEGRIRGRLHKTPGRVHRMDDRHAKSPASRESPRGFGYGGRHVVNILQGHEGD